MVINDQERARARFRNPENFKIKPGTRTKNFKTRSPPRKIFKPGTRPGIFRNFFFQMKYSGRHFKDPYQILKIFSDCTFGFYCGNNKILKLGRCWPCLNILVHSTGFHLRNQSVTSHLIAKSDARNATQENFTRL